MSSRIEDLISREVVKRGEYPQFLKNGCVHYETITGSFAYGCSGGSSDLDIYAWGIPPKQYLFQNNKVSSFDNYEHWDQWQRHGLIDDKKEYDLTVFNIARYFYLCMDGNANMIDTLFTPQHAILHMTPIAVKVRQNAELFLSKKCYHTFTGYLHSQMVKMKRKPEGKRAALVAKFGYDVKFMYHAVRLSLELEQILETGTIDLMRDKEIYKAIRRGDWTFEEGRKFVMDQERRLKELYDKSTAVPNKPPKEKIRNLLIDCLEQHFGTLTNNEASHQNKYENMIQEIRSIVNK